LPGLYLPAPCDRFCGIKEDVEGRRGYGKTKRLIRRLEKRFGKNIRVAQGQPLYKIRFCALLDGVKSASSGLWPEKNSK
jgi:hypothetical protein